MKLLIPLIIFASFSKIAHAHPGSHHLLCKSAKNSGSTQKLEVSLRRSNGTGWAEPKIDMTVDNQQFRLETPDENNNYGTTFHNSPLKVITVTAYVPTGTHINSGGFNIVAIPETVKAFDYNNEPVIWKLENEKDECNDTNGRATFQAIINGYYIRDTQTDIHQLDPQVMDCELIYNSGMAC